MQCNFHNLTTTTKKNPCLSEELTPTAVRHLPSSVAACIEMDSGFQTHRHSNMQTETPGIC